MVKGERFSLVLYPFDLSPELASKASKVDQELAVPRAFWGVFVGLQLAYSWPQKG